MKDDVGHLIEQLLAVRELLDDVLVKACQPRAADPINDDRLRTVLTGLERVKNAAEATQAQAMVSMGKEALALDAAERGDSDLAIRSHEEFVPDEIAVLLACTKPMAAVRYGTAWDAIQHPALVESWSSGLIDARKVSAIAELLQPLDSAPAAEVAASAVDYATTHTPTQTREWLRRRVVAADPDAAERRRLEASQQRRVVITPTADGMAELWALLPAVEGRQIQLTLTQMARDLGAGDPRTMDQRRTDVLTDLLLGKQESVPVNVSVIVPADTLSGGSREPAWIPGWGPITADQAHELMGERAGIVQSVQVLLADAESGVLSGLSEHRYRPSRTLQAIVRARDVTCRFPGCRRAASESASGTDLDHTVPWPRGETSAANLAVLCRRHHRLKHSTTWRVEMSPDNTMTWTTPSGREYQSEPWQYVEPPYLE
ncbi:MAG TPA: DUF222 domain-containing protein [Actinomycetes bacterium]|nr:DUF222 domain-containing protein [Actinomycetes bacterium]